MGEKMTLEQLKHWARNQVVLDDVTERERMEAIAAIDELTQPAQAVDVTDADVNIALVAAHADDTFPLGHQFTQRERARMRAALERFATSRTLPTANDTEDTPDAAR